MKIVNIDGENLHTSERLEEFQGNFREICDFLKVTKKQGFTLPLEDTFLEKPQGDRIYPPPS